MTITLSKRRLFLGLAAGALGLAGILWVARQALTSLAVHGLLNLAGATQVSFAITEATPWRVVVEDIRFHLRTQPFAAKRVSMVRSHWWTPSLGVVRVEAASVPVALDDLVKPSPPEKPRAKPTTEPGKLPLEEFSLDGKLQLSVGETTGETIAISLQAKANETGRVTAQVHASAQGLAIAGNVNFNPATSMVAFQATSVAIDVQAWQGWAQGAMDLPATDWVAAGKLTGSVEGQWADGKLAGTARAHLREARVENRGKAITATGIEADLEITDLAQFATKPATLRVRAMQAGQLKLAAMNFEFHFASRAEVAVSKATLQALGGTISAEPFRYRFAREEIDAVVVVEGIDVADIMALTPDLPAKATGRVNGRFPLHLDSAGLRLGTGWLQLKPGAYAEIQFNAAGLLTGSAAPNSPSYAVLKKVESGLLKLKVKELRLDIRPPNVPEGRSAQLHVAGEPVDPQVKAPVVLDLNVNGPLEKLINFGLDSRLSFGSKP